MNIYEKNYWIGKYIPLILTIGDWMILNLSYNIIFLIIHRLDKVVFFDTILLLNISYIFFVTRIYKLHIRRTIRIERLLSANLINSICIFVTFIFFLYIGRYQLNILYLIIFYTSYFILFSGWTIICKKTINIYRKKGYNFKTAIVVGSASIAEDLITQLIENLTYGIKIVKVFEDGSLSSANVREIINDEIFPIEYVDDYILNNRVDIIYYASDSTNLNSIRNLMEIADKNGITFTYIAKLPKAISSQFVPSKVGSLPALSLTLSPLFSFSNKLLKRSFDLFFSSVFLCFFPLVYIPIAIGIKLTSPGPVFFKQKRTGLYGKDFYCYKFRTMKINADSDKRQATKDDPRKTKFGNFLRKTSLDELPQFINVFLGNMSVVGPRPHMVSQTEIYRKQIDKYMIRHAVKPGITGWAQVNGFRGATEYLWQMEKRVEYDVNYITNWNFFLDIKIIFLTVFNQLVGEDNAY